MELTKKNIDDLTAETIEPCISIYMPLSKTLREKTADKVRLENLLKTAARKIIAAGSQKSFARQFVEPGFALARDHFFWKTDAKGLAVFIAAPTIIRYFLLPDPPKETVFVGKGFDTARAKKILEKNRDFYVLAVTKKRLRFFGPSQGIFKEISIRGLPDLIKNLLPGRDPEKSIQFHGQAPLGKSEIAHGHGREKDTRNDLMLKYFQKTDRLVSRYLTSKSHPLIFAGTDSLFALYRQANTYPRLSTKSLKGNFDKNMPDEIFKKASAIARFEN